MPIHPRIAALISVVLWSTGALFVLGLHRLPPCLILAISSSVSLGFTAVFLAWTGRWRLLAKSTHLLLPAGSMLILNQVCYVVAFRNAPAAQVDLINYLWPSMLVLLTGNFTGRFTAYLVVAAGASGIFVAFDPSALNREYFPGYIAAFVAALSWARYSLLVRKHDLPPEFLSMNIGLGAPIYWAAHYMLGEPSVCITLSEAGLLLSYGGGVYVVAYLCWGFSVRFGSVGEASALSYLIPLLSIASLALFGYAEFTARLSWATALVLLAAIIPLFTSKGRQEQPELKKV